MAWLAGSRAAGLLLPEEEHRPDGASVVEVTSCPRLGPSLARSQVGQRTSFFRAVVDLRNHGKLPSALAGRSNREPDHGPAAYRIAV